MIIRKKYNTLFWIQNALLSVVISMSAVFCIPNIINYSIGKEKDHPLVWIGLILSGIAIWGILVWMGYKRCQIPFLQMIGRIFILCMIGFIAILLISALCGVVSSILYFLLKNIFFLDQIKGIITISIRVITIVFLPLLFHGFWKGISISEGFFQGLKDAIVIKKRQYINTLGVLFIVFALGILITTIFHWVSPSIGTDIVKVLLFSVIGTVVLSVTEQILR